MSAPPRTQDHQLCARGFMAHGHLKPPGLGAQTHFLGHVGRPTHQAHRLTRKRTHSHQEARTQGTENQIPHGEAAVSGHTWWRGHPQCQDQGVHWSRGTLGACPEGTVTSGLRNPCLQVTLGSSASPAPLAKPGSGRDPGQKEDHPAVGPAGGGSL